MVMRTQVRYLTESHPSTEAWGDLTKDFTQSDNYYYLLELDDDERILVVSGLLSQLSKELGDSKIVPIIFGYP